MGRSSLVILGGGFAGTTLARRLESRLPDDWDMTLISQENCITYQPLLAARRRPMRRATASSSWPTA